MAYNKRLLFGPLFHNVVYLVVGGGGGAGADMGAGGGAGGFQSSITSSVDSDRNQLFSTVYNTGTPTTASLAFGVTYEIEIGGGGAGSPSGNTSPTGDNGGDSFISSSDSKYPFSVYSFGGGAGASDYGTGNSVNFNARSGSSGGGATGNGSPQAFGTDGQGFEGGAYGGSYYPGSGGGAGGPGRANPGDGGIGRRWDILGQEYWWAGGGAGAGYSARAGNGGKGGGGAPRVSGGGSGDNSGLAWNNGADAQAGSLGQQTNKLGGSAGANTGGGGGGGSHYTSNNAGGNGGSGMVVIQMQKALYSGIHTGDPEIRSGSIDGVSDLEHVALIFTQSGTYTAVNATGSIS